MENKHIYDTNYYKYVGWGHNNDSKSSLFTNNTIRMISEKITELLMGVDPQNRPIKVDDKVILDTLFQVKSSHESRQVGDMYSRHVISYNTSYDEYKVIDETIGLIVNGVKNDIGMREYNNSLSIWTTVLGDHNQHGLRSHPPLKLRHKKPMSMQFNMNY